MHNLNHIDDDLTQIQTLTRAAASHISPTTNHQHATAALRHAANIVRSTK